MNTTTAPHIVLPLPSPGTAALIHRIVALPEYPVEAYLNRLPAPWKDIAENLIATPPISAERALAMSAALTTYANIEELQAAIMRGQLEGPLALFQEFVDRFTIHSIGRAFEPLEPLQYLVERIIPQGSLVILYGQPGCGKTWALFALCICVAAGINFGNFTTTQTPVLIIDEESGHRRIKERLKRVALAMGRGLIFH